MIKRTITALALIIVFATAFMIGNSALTFLIQGIILIAGYEVYTVKKDKWPFPILIMILVILFSANFVAPNLVLPFLSIMLITTLFASIVSVKFSLEDALFVFFMLFVLSLALMSIKQVMTFKLTVFAYIIIATFVTDTFAYLGGSLFGKHKLIERISPNKTIEGAVIGYIASVILSLVFAKFFVDLNLSIILVSSFVIPIVSQIGDLTFSMVKRTYGIKDFGFILPGHGGVLDRIDSIVFSLLVFNVILTLLG